MQEKDARHNTPDAQPRQRKPYPWPVRILTLLLALLVLGGSIFVCFMPAGRGEGAFTVLKKGMTGRQVLQMQQALSAMGYYDGRQDGNFSRALEAAVLAFQQDFGLTQTGTIDYDAYTLLLSEVPDTPPEATPAPTRRAAAPPSAQPSEALEAENAVRRDAWYSDKEHVAAYLRAFGTLPGNYIKKAEAEALGWSSAKGNLWQVAPGKSIGGDRFGNYEGKLPAKRGRQYYECDVDYDGGFRGAKRIVFSSDGLIYYTQDHYATFEEIK